MVARRGSCWVIFMVPTVTACFSVQTSLCSSLGFVFCWHGYSESLMVIFCEIIYAQQGNSPAQMGAVRPTTSQELSGLLFSFSVCMIFSCIGLNPLEGFLPPCISSQHLTVPFNNTHHCITELKIKIASCMARIRVRTVRQGSTGESWIWPLFNVVQ